MFQSRYGYDQAPQNFDPYAPFYHKSNSPYQYGHPSPQYSRDHNSLARLLYYPQQQSSLFSQHTYAPQESSRVYQSPVFAKQPDQEVAQTFANYEYLGQTKADSAPFSKNSKLEVQADNFGWTEDKVRPELEVFDQASLGTVSQYSLPDSSQTEPEFKHLNGDNSFFNINIQGADPDQDKDMTTT